MQYFRRFSADDGEAIPALFTDEPHISPSRVCDGGAAALPFSCFFAHEFELLNGYSLLRNLPGVFRNVTGCVPDRLPEKVRFDYG